jgi:hypothetical protein
MALVSEGIEAVRVFELPVGVWADGGYVAALRAALVTWRSSLEGKYHQIYVNGRYAGSTIDAGQRQIVVQVPSSFESAVRIEVFGVEPDQAHIDFSSELAAYGVDSGRVKVKMLRSQHLPADATVNIYCDGGTGSIDYGQPLNKEVIHIWPTWQDKAGFSMAGFGVSDFGWDCAAAVGFGRGIFGEGEFGIDADTVECVSEPMPMGAYRFGVKIIDEWGNESIASEVGPVVVTPGARPAKGLEVASFDVESKTLVLECKDPR